MSSPPPVPSSISWLLGRSPASLWADVSRWVRVGDMRAYAAASGCKLLGVKVAEGAGWTGEQEAQKVVESALAEGLIVVGYQYGPAHPEAFLRAFPPRPGCIPCLDFEFSAKQKSALTDRQRVIDASLWITKVQNAWGRDPWFYGRADWIACGQPSGTLIAKVPFWGAQYGDRLYIPRGVGPVVAWQYTDGHAGPAGAPRTHVGIEKDEHGATRPCDMNVLFVDQVNLRYLAGLQHSSPTP